MEISGSAVERIQWAKIGKGTWRPFGTFKNTWCWQLLHVSLTLVYLLFLVSIILPHVAVQLPSYRARAVESWELVNKSKRKGYEMERSRRKLNWFPGFPCASYHANNLMSDVLYFKYSLENLHEMTFCK